MAAVKRQIKGGYFASVKRLRRFTGRPSAMNMSARLDLIAAPDSQYRKELEGNMRRMLQSNGRIRQLADPAPRKWVESVEFVGDEPPYREANIRVCSLMHQVPERRGRNGEWVDLEPKREKQWVWRHDISMTKTRMGWLPSKVPSEAYDYLEGASKCMPFDGQ